MKLRILLFLLGSLPSMAADAPTFTENVAPILYQNCVVCHRPGGGGPFALISYEDAAKRGRLIAEVTARRFMPPWHATSEYGSFTGERRLASEQIKVLADWAAHGMARGEARKMPTVPHFSDGWQLGEPDLVLELPEGFQVPASGPDVYRNFALPTGLAEDKWVRAVEFRPTARQAVHHALFAYVPGGSMHNMEGRDGQPGFGGAMAIGLTPGQQGSGSLGGWAVGGRPLEFPEGIANRLPKGSDFVLQVHFHLTGKTEIEKPTIGIYFAKAPPTKIAASLDLPALFGFGAGLDIPAGANTYTIADSFTLPGDVAVFGAYAHAHYLGKEMRVTATLPDGSAKSLFRVPQWNFNWQEVYRFKEPVKLPAGTRIDATIVYDNSAANPRNPNSPPAEVKWGMESTDEMGQVGLAFEILHAEDEAEFRSQLSARTTAAIQKGVADGTVAKFLRYQQQMQTPSGPQK
jgi:hypothetical protein